MHRMAFEVDRSRCGTNADNRHSDRKATLKRSPREISKQESQMMIGA
jgi:hypothetical protein